MSQGSHPAKPDLLTVDAARTAMLAAIEELTTERVALDAVYGRVLREGVRAGRDQPPFAAFEAPSINLKYIASRLRHDYYARWVRDPQRIDPTTKMPKYEDDEGKTGLATFDNDGAKQFAAVWQYLLEGEHLKPPQ